jgi:hypothetical protein
MGKKSNEVTTTTVFANFASTFSFSSSAIEDRLQLCERRRVIVSIVLDNDIGFIRYLLSLLL